SKSFHEHETILLMLQTFRIYASYLIQRYVMAIHDMNACDACKLEYEMDSSSEVIPTYHHRTYPLVETYLQDSDPNDQIAYTSSNLLELEYRHVGIPMQLPYQLYIVQLHDELLHHLASNMVILHQL